MVEHGRANLRSSSTIMLKKQVSESARAPPESALSASQRHHVDFADFLKTNSYCIVNGNLNLEYGHLLKSQIFHVKLTIFHIPLSAAIVNVI